MYIAQNHCSHLKNILLHYINSCMYTIKNCPRRTKEREKEKEEKGRKMKERETEEEI